MRRIGFLFLSKQSKRRPWRSKIMKARTRTSMAWIIVLAFSAIGFMHYDDPGNEPAPVPWYPNLTFSCLTPFHCAIGCEVNTENPNWTCTHYLPADPNPSRCKYTGIPTNSCTPLPVICAYEKRYSQSVACYNGFCVGGILEAELEAWDWGCYGN